jgi:hypothetical protein
MRMGWGGLLMVSVDRYNILDIAGKYLFCKGLCVYVNSINAPCICGKSANSYIEINQLKTGFYTGDTNVPGFFVTHAANK